MNDYFTRIPPLYWVKDKRRGGVVSVAPSGQQAVCFFSTEDKACDYAEHHIGGMSGGPDWEAVGSEHVGDLLKIADNAPQQGYRGWVLDPPLDVSSAYLTNSWSELREEMERKVDVRAAWGPISRS